MHTLAAANISAEDVTRLLIALAVLLGLARVLGEVARKLKQPAVLGEILAGVLLGATVLGNPALLGPDGFNVKLYHWVFPEYMLNEAGEQVQAVVVPPEHVTEKVLPYLGLGCSGIYPWLLGLPRDREHAPASGEGHPQGQPPGQLNQGVCGRPSSVSGSGRNCPDASVPSGWST